MTLPAATAAGKLAWNMLVSKKARPEVAVGGDAISQCFIATVLPVRT